MYGFLFIYVSKKKTKQNKNKRKNNTHQIISGGIIMPHANCVCVCGGGVGGVYCFHVVRPLVGPSATFWFFNILKRQ